MALFFITNLATILLYMRTKVSRDGSENLRAYDIEFFKKKMASYEVVFEAVLAQFNDSMFGSHQNSVSKAEFQAQLAFEGWKYFNVQNLNELFAIKYREKVDSGLISQVDLKEDNELSEVTDGSFLQPIFSILSTDP